MKLSLAETIKWTRIWGYVAIMLIFGIIAFKYHQDGFMPYIVQSGSMSPTLPIGSVVITVPTSTIAVGDVITYTTKEGAIVTHRVAEILNGGRELMYVTKGDANKVQDDDSIPQSMLVGKVSMTIPSIGKIFSYTKTLPGFVLFIVIPALYLLLHGVWGIIQAFKGNNTVIQPKNGLSQSKV